RVREVGDAVADAIGRRSLAEGRQTAAPGRGGPGPGARGVDHAGGEDPFLAPVGVLDVHDEGLGVAVGVHDAVAAGLRHAGDPGTVTDPVTENGGERPQVVLDPVAAARVGAGVGLAPACRGKELLGGRVDVFATGG